MSAVSLLDWVLLGVLLFSVGLGWMRGLVFELFSLLAWVLAFVLARWWAPAVSDGLAAHVGGVLADPSWRGALVFAVLFVAVVLCTSAVGVVLRKLLAAMGLSVADRGLGALFGGLRAGVGVLALAMILPKTPWQDGAWLRNSVGMHVAGQVLQTMAPILPKTSVF